MFLLKSDAFWRDEGGPPSNSSLQESILSDLEKWLNFSGKKTFRGVKSPGNSPGAGETDRVAQGPRGKGQIIGFQGSSAPKRTKRLGKGSGFPPSPILHTLPPLRPPIWPCSSPPRSRGHPKPWRPTRPPPKGTHGSGTLGPARGPLGPALLRPARRGLRLLHAALGPAPAGPARLPASAAAAAAAGG